MKKYFKYAQLFVAALVLAAGFTSCGSSNENQSAQDLLTEQNAAIKELTNTYLEAVVYPTYTSLANQCEALYTQISAFNAKLQGGQNVTDEEVKTICNTYKVARKYWEESEAFLFGAASDFNIDPHIDSWPLDLPTLKDILIRSEVVNNFKNMNDKDAITYARRTLSADGQLGFHGIEFIFFRNGNPRPASFFNNNQNEVHPGFITTSDGITAQTEVLYAKVVAGDLRDKTYQLEVAWRGNTAPAAHIARVTECQNNGSFGADYGTTTATKLSYGADMLAAGTAQSSLAAASIRKVLETIFVAGCSNICAEVANQKMGQAYRSANGQGKQDDDPNYIESPYSYNSFTDFYDNIMSIQNSLYGNIGANTGSYAKSSIMAFLAKYYPDAAASLQSKLTSALAALKACQNSGTPFVKSPGAPIVGAAISAVGELDDELNRISNLVLKGAN